MNYERNTRDDAPVDPSASAAAVEQLVQIHRELVDFVSRRVASRAEAEDIVQDAFVRSVEHAEALRDAESARAWMYRMLRNAVVDRYRRGASAMRAADALADESEWKVEPDAEADAVVCRCVLRLVATLKPEHAQALVRIDVEEAGLAVLAGELGITRNNAGVRVFRARESLRRRLAEACGTCATHGCLDCECDESDGRRA